MKTLKFEIKSVQEIRNEFPQLTLLEGLDADLIGVTNTTPNQLVYKGDNFLNNGDETQNVFYFSSLEDFPNTDLSYLTDKQLQIIKQILVIPKEFRPIFMDRNDVIPFD